MKPVDYVRERMQLIARRVDDELPEGWGFIVLVFPFGKSPDDPVLYVSNGTLESTCRVMQEFIDRHEKTPSEWGNETPAES